MHARVFRHITKRFSTISKTLLLALFLFATTLGMATPLLAQSTEADLKLKYTNYLTLTTYTGSELTSAGLTQDATTQSIIGLKFNIKFSLNTSTGKTLENAWSYIAPAEGGSMNTSEGFLIRLCSDANPSQCWVNTIPYRGDAASGGVETRAVISRVVNGNYSAGPEITNFSAFNKNDQNNNTPGGNGQRFKYDRDISNGKNEGKISAGNIDFRPGDDVTATLWYCAANSTGDTGVSAYKDMGNKGLGDTVATFDTLCGGGSYFRIGDPVSISIPTIASDINALVNNSAATSKTVSNEDTNLPTCDIGFFGTSNPVGCLARIIYYGLYWPSAWVAGLFGSLFDFFIGYSVSDESYRYAFAVNGWKLVRDIANVMFIIIMVYVGFAAVFSFGGKGGSTMRKVVPILIFNALIINFSLFATRTVIDLSNITARVFYSRMVVCDGKCVDEDNNGTPENIKRGLGGHWPLSEKIVGAFDPQKMFSASILNPKETPTGGGDPNDPFAPTNSSDIGRKAEQGKGYSQDSSEYSGYYALVSLIAAGIMLGIAAMFFKVMFMFLGRVIGLYMAMIFSPFAFLTRGGMPLFNIKGYTWDAWVKNLFDYAALAPVFTFFLYIVYSFLNTDIVKEIGVEDKTGGFFGTVLSIVIPMLFIYFLISKGVDIAKKYSGEFGEKVQAFGNTVSGFALGAATGGAALVGGRMVGGMAKRIDESRIGVGIRNMASQSGVAGWVGKNLQRGVNATRAGSYDVRQTKLGQGVFKQFGMDTNQKGLNTLAGVGLGLGTDQRKGGIESDIKRREEKKVKIEQLLVEKMSDEDLKGYFEKYNERKKEKYEKKLAPVNAAVEQAMATAAGISVADVQLLKTTNPTSYETQKTAALAADATLKKKVDAIGKPPAEVSTAEGLTADRRTAYAEKIKRGGYVTQGLDWMARQGEGGAQISDLLGATVGAAIGNQVRQTGNKKAAKKITEKNKISQDLGKIKEVLDKGFKELISLEQFKDTATFRNLPVADREAILKGDKSFYDLLTPAEKTNIDTLQKGMTKEKRAEYESKIKAIEGSKYNIKELQKTLNERKKDWLNLERDPNATRSQRQQASKEWMDSITELEKAQKHNKTWADVNKHIEEQKKKLKDEEEKK